MVENPELSVQGMNRNRSPIHSYKDVDLNKELMCEEEEEEDDDWWHKYGWKSCITVDTLGKVPNIVLSQELRDKMARKWRHYLIVSVLGMAVREDLMAKKLDQLWGDLNTMDTGSGFFMVNCKREEIYDLALSGGQWLIFDHYISVQPWRPDFNSKGERVYHIAAWAGIARLSLDYYDRGIMYLGGSQIGEVLKVDKNTLSRTKGRFARVCVKLDLTKPLLPSIKINGIEKKIEYEGLHMICFNCGKYGHDKDHCSTIPQSIHQSMIQGKEQDKQMHSPSSSVYGKQEVPFRGWMVVQRNWKGKQGGRLEGKRARLSLSW